MPVIRRGEAGDLAQVAAIQHASPEAPRWNAAEYLNYDLLVAVCENRVAGFLAWRALVEGESEILNLAVAPEFRRQGVARRLWKAFLGVTPGTVFLEVRESNKAARNLYVSLGFQELGRRPGYYQAPLEAAIVMKFHSC
jgi:ribosomal-protein-alanine N-acetyltransferase